MIGAGSDYEVREETCETFLVNDARSLKQLQSLFEEVEKKSKGVEEKITEESPLILFFQIYRGLIQINVETMLEVLVCDKFY